MKFKKAFKELIEGGRPEILPQFEEKVLEDKGGCEISFDDFKYYLQKTREIYARTR